jgi:hypothetical protein
MSVLRRVADFPSTVVGVLGACVTLAQTLLQQANESPQLVVLRRSLPASTGHPRHDAENGQKAGTRKQSLSHHDASPLKLIAGTEDRIVDRR